MQKLRGFTIIEALIVVVIIGIIAAIVIATISGLQSNGEKHYMIDTADGTTYWTNSYEEKDGCILFDSWRGHSKACGTYTVREW